MIKPDHDTEKARRAERVRTGRSPAQRTKLSRNKVRWEKYPGKGNRREWRRREDF